MLCSFLLRKATAKSNMAEVISILNNHTQNISAALKDTKYTKPLAINLHQK